MDLYQQQTGHSQTQTEYLREHHYIITTKEEGNGEKMWCVEWMIVNNELMPLKSKNNNKREWAMNKGGDRE